MKKIGLIALAVIVAAVVAFFAFKFFSGTHPRSKILLAKPRITITKDGKEIIQTPIAEVPGLRNEAAWESIEGKVTFISNDKGEKMPSEVTTLLMGSETVVVTNMPYVNSLHYLYSGNNVILKGKWIKSAVIYGKKYRVFWVEYIALKSAKQAAGNK